MKFGENFEFDLPKAKSFCNVTFFHLEWAYNEKIDALKDETDSFT